MTVISPKMLFIFSASTIVRRQNPYAILFLRWKMTHCFCWDLKVQIKTPISYIKLHHKFYVP